MRSKADFLSPGLLALFLNTAIIGTLTLVFAAVAYGEVEVILPGLPSPPASVRVWIFTILSFALLAFVIRAASKKWQSAVMKAFLWITAISFAGSAVVSLINGYTISECLAGFGYIIVASLPAVFYGMSVRESLRYILNLQ